MLSHRSPLLYSRYMMRLKGPVGIILQGALVVLVGALITVFSLNNTVPIKKVTGAIQHDYVESLTNYASGSQVYDNTYLDIGGTDGLFIFGKNNFHPVWDDHVFVGQKEFPVGAVLSSVFIKASELSRSRIQLLILVVVAPIFVPLSISQNLC